jgi:oxygen-independent coproporphyrinogen-3 oxidase
MAAARAIGFRSTKVDLIYGLTKKTLESFARTLEQVCQIGPERIALYAYAHLPERFKPQRRIDAASLPPAEQRVAMLAAAIARFSEAGYDYVGMDHFALPDDPLAIARREGRLHRNFQGYSTQPDCDLIGLGVSAIGKVGDTYSQNAKTLDGYAAAIDAGAFAVERGLQLSADDRLRRDAIMALMCQGRLDVAAFEQAHAVRFAERFADELRALEPLQANGLVERGTAGLQVTPLGWFFVRSIASVFDGYLRRSGSGAVAYSRAV